MTHDMVGLFERFVPEFVKQYVQIRPIILEAMNDYRGEVVNVTFPATEHSFTMPDEVLEELKEMIK